MEREFIDKKALEDYFNGEADAARESYNALISLPVEERVHKRKCICGLKADVSYNRRTQEGDVLLKLDYEENLSDFKEGDYLMLHDGGHHGIRCNVADFIGDNSIVVSLDKYMNIKSLSGKELVLDKALVDLRVSIFTPFLNSLPDDGDFWTGHLVNSRPQAQFSGIEECRAELDDTVKNFGLSLLPKQYEAVLNCMAAENLYLVQGPPGTGKSYVLAVVMLEELLWARHKVAVVGPNHMAINNALEKFVALCPQMYDSVAKVGKWISSPRQLFDIHPARKPVHNISRKLDVEYLNSVDEPFIMGLTPHTLYTSKARGLKFDTLIIDEAGQKSIPLAMMAMQFARKVILAGDHKQLPPIITGEKIPQALNQSVFQRLMNSGNCTMLDTTFRMNAPICSFVSQLFYEGKLCPVRSGVRQAAAACVESQQLADAPIVFYDVADSGRQVSEKEAERIAEICRGLIKTGMPGERIGVLAPFRAQVSRIRRALRNSGAIPQCQMQSVESVEKHMQSLESQMQSLESVEHQLRSLESVEGQMQSFESQLQSVVVDTVDKLQGQERDVIIYSMTSGDLAYMSEMGDFLYNPQKINVAFSRAKSRLIITGNATSLKALGQEQFPILGEILGNDGVRFFS